MNQNPYAAPQSQVAPSHALPGGDLLDPPKACDAGAALSWLSKGWTLFMQAPGAWVLMALLFLVGYMIVAFIPMGGLIIQILLPMVLAGMYIGADKLNFGEDIAVGVMFEGFSRNAAQLALVGLVGLLLQLVLAIIVLVPFFLIFGLSLFSGDKPDFGTGSVIALAVVGLIFMVGSYLIALAAWFAPMLVAMNDMDAVSAVKLSFAAGMRNLGATIVMFLLMMLLMIGGLLTLGLGMLVVFPVLATASYAGYREIFYGD